ncbi:MAG: hypothetical protein C7B44_04770 [Sulfobacillus thermosulfidooxidans]|uniref:hypothetical protein n=1 Tax=Sulfobacillus TaxID=28033 RepID=UPI000CD1044D|nr:hypothetical protein [Sulfobacillus sp. hq2]POB11938.1 hypothetical protein CO251_02210 [Sulfobacillus sp. hq2]PSR37250.1 MAG: hypothetical protein C7B44_04770 [Sulfobacillus thermosulfidooxidans]
MSKNVRLTSLYVSFGTAVMTTVALSQVTSNLMVLFVILMGATGAVLGFWAALTKHLDAMASMSGATAGGVMGALLSMAITVTWLHPMHSHQGMMIMGDTMAQMAGAALAGFFVPEATHSSR